MKRPNPTRWLWWTALVILGLGAAFIALIYHTTPGPQTFTPEMRMIALIAVVLAGLCVISATAQRWMQR